MNWKARLAGKEALGILQSVSSLQYQRDGFSQFSPYKKAALQILPINVLHPPRKQAVSTRNEHVGGCFTFLFGWFVRVRFQSGVFFFPRRRVSFPVLSSTQVGDRVGEAKSLKSLASAFLNYGNAAEACWLSRQQGMDDQKKNMAMVVIVVLLVAVTVVWFGSL